MRAPSRLVLGALAFFGAGFMSEPIRAADKPDVVRLGWFGGPRPWVIGKAEGLFEKDLGTKVEWVQFPSGAAALNSLAAREIDISRLGSPPTVAAMVRNLPIELIAISGVIATSERLIAKQGIKDVSGLRGKTAAYPPGSTAHYALMAALKVAKVAPNEVKLLALAPNEMLAAWERGDIDSAFVWGPFSHRMEKAGGQQILVAKDLQANGYYVWNDYVVRTEFAAKYPDIVAQFLKTFQKTIDMYNNDKDAMVKLVAKHLNQEEAAVADTMAGLYFPPLKEQLSSQFLGEGGPIVKAMKDQADFLAELGDLRKRDVPESFAKFVNTEYLKRAVER